MYSSRHSFAHPAVWLKSANAGLRPPTSQSDGKGAFPLTHWDRTLRTIRSLLSASTRTQKEHNSFTYIILFYVILYSIFNIYIYILKYITVNYITSYHIILNYILVCYILVFHIISYHIILYYIIFYYITLHYIIYIFMCNVKHMFAATLMEVMFFRTTTTPRGRRARSLVKLSLGACYRVWAALPLQRAWPLLYSPRF